MRELKILAVLVFFTGLLYWGVEPFAHSQMHPHVDAPDYSFKDTEKIEPSTAGLTGDATKGGELVSANCTACHSIEKAGFPQLMDNASAAAAYGVVPPDLSTAGLLYDEKFLAAFIKDPVSATKTAHAFVDGKTHPMPGYGWMQPQEIADIVAYLKSIAPKSLTNKEVFQDACQRCHGIKYGDFFGGSMAAKTPVQNIKSYMGKIPPDLSQYIRSRGANWLHEFINDPQKHLHGTAMPRVGLTKASEDQIIAYMTEVGDSSKPKREALAGPFLAYLAIFAIFAWLWKARVWKEVH
jgi:ubiquinol-cytochrome c reductase cytochrome c1 subunit